LDRAGRPIYPVVQPSAAKGALIGTVGGVFWGAIGGWITDALIRKREIIYLAPGRKYQFDKVRAGSCPRNRAQDDCDTWVAFVVALLLRVNPSVRSPAIPVQLRPTLARC
jgi:hypothetical protein